MGDHEDLPPVARRAINRFRAEFDRNPEAVVRAPGRVNLIGEHTDYNDGFVLPMAIERAVWIAVAPQDGHVTLVSDDIAGQVDVHLDDVGDRLAGWGAYVQGVVWAHRRADVDVGGLCGAVASDVPTGAGLSSSAALEMAVACALVADADWDPVSAAQLGQEAENAWVGVSSGIMDQLASAAARRGHALLIDCRSLDISHVSLPDNVHVVVLDTATRRELTTSAYNDRRTQCEAAAVALGVASLRDAELAAVERLADPVLRRRARHVVTEHARTAAAADALRTGDLTAVGRLMAQAHASMRDDFEASGPALDAMVACAERTAGCIGARMTGGGFGGCAVALVEAGYVDAFTDTVSRDYPTATGNTPRLYPTAAADGTRRTSLR